MADGAADPSNACRWCDVSADPDGWTNKPDGAACDEADACTLSDQRQAAACSGTPITVWPAPDAFEPDDLAHLPNDQIGTAWEVVVTPGPQTPSIHEGDSGDHYYWGVNNTLGFVTGYWLCRVTGLTPGQKVIVWAGANVGGYPPGQAFNTWNLCSDVIGNGVVWGGSLPMGPGL